MSKSIEDYLKGIYILKSRKLFSNKKLSEYLNISPASVSEMMKKLEREEYIVTENKKIKLTRKGEEKAKSIIRRHRVWEVFLAEKLEYDLSDIHEEAEMLEHVTSDKLLRKLEKFLFYPKECPHGSPIVYSNNFLEKNIMTLSEVEIGDEIIILNVEDNIDLYDYLKELDIKINENYKLDRKDPFNGPYHLTNDSGEIKIIAYEATKLIKVYMKYEEDNDEVYD